ncbi:hypothetical protein T4D_5031 [Trichinella pseudospiralis]|uniref:Uncharacterized protein n=1 Tax=Trichinella pseudospiralis TaxID=6337 RepID=A0A0V1DLX0_TRIPS|nr:hypothetical protein T4D_5031 [Trichinella pseudospiralis]
MGDPNEKRKSKVLRHLLSWQKGGVSGKESLLAKPPGL